MENLYDLFWKSSDINGGNMKTVIAEPGTWDTKPISLTKNTKSKRAILIARKNSDLMAQLRAVALEEGLIRDDEPILIKIGSSTRVEFSSTPLSRRDTIKWLKSLLSPKSGLGLTGVTLEHLEYVLKNVDKPVSWWTDWKYRRRAKVFEFVNSRLQAALRAQAGIKARTTICTNNTSLSNSDPIGFEVRLGKNVDISLNP